MDFLAEPSLPVAVVEVILGVILLAKAADRFVDGASGIAGSLRVSPVVVGAVIVGFGTSLPELLVSGLAATDGNLSLGVGNIAGSNVANLTLVLGSAALLVPVLVDRDVLAREAPLSLLSVLLFGFCTLGGLALGEGILLLVGLALVMTWIAVAGRLPLEDFKEPDDGQALSARAVTTLLGLVGTVAGAQLLVWGAVAIADALNIGGGLIGFTLVAVGTSLPELVTALAAARRQETQLLLGNLLGSNMFNSLAVGGAISVLGPGDIEDRALATAGIAGMVLVAVLAWAFMVTRRRIHRIEAVILLLAWVVSVVVMADDQSLTDTVLMGR